MCKRAGLSLVDMEIMTVGGSMDFIEEYVDWHNPKKKKHRRANQSDFDKF
ncbi:hypothetical protein [Halalkalibacter sp. APA_J-10(15)]|nr:hypothetical protein [Halalkalibacter sp. APA_J-10(15)]